MINHDRRFKLIIFLAIALAFFVSIACVSTAFAQSAAQTASNNLNAAAAKANGGTAPTITDVPTTIGNIVGVVLSFIGVLFLGLMIFGGFTWMLARGNQQNTQKAKELIEAAVIGLIIVMAAYAITAYVGSVLLSTT